MAMTNWEAHIDAAISRLTELYDGLPEADRDEDISGYRSVVAAIKRQRGARAAAEWLDEKLAARLRKMGLPEASAAISASKAPKEQARQGRKLRGSSDVALTKQLLDVGLNELHANTIVEQYGRDDPDRITWHLEELQRLTTIGKGNKPVRWLRSAIERDYRPSERRAERSRRGRPTFLKQSSTQVRQLQDDNVIDVVDYISLLGARDTRSVHEIRYAVKVLDEKAKENPKLLFQLARHQITLGDFGTAYRTFLEIVRLNPDNAGSHQALGECLLMLGRAAESIAELNLAMSLGLTGFRKYAGYCCRAHAQLLLKNCGSALQDVEEALLLFPKAEGARTLQTLIIEKELEVPGVSLDK